ncbi:MAG: hypothetical protein IT288_15410 [Bdellovibrionales bacterium]|nr:hypothetical protein [Bdellovibrionales bacterium]
MEWSRGVERFFSSEFCSQLDYLYICGNYGDAAAASGLTQFVEHLFARGLKGISICSNGSLRTPEWWAALGQMLKGRGQLVFSIDGIGEVNAKYRRGSSWEKILANLEAVSQTGVFLRWDFIVFRHNEHQIDEVRALARRLGFNQINFRSPSRLSLQPTLGFEPPLNPQFAPQNARQMSQIQEKYGTFDRYAKQTRVHCKTQLDSGSIYIDFRGEVWPCCWVGAPRYLSHEDRQRRDLEKMIGKYEPGFNSIENFTLEEILAHPFFARDLEQSWHDPESRLFTCGRTCGESFEYTCLPRYGNSHMETLATNPDFNWVWD